VEGQEPVAADAVAMRAVVLVAGCPGRGVGDRGAYVAAPGTCDDHRHGEHEDATHHNAASSVLRIVERARSYGQGEAGEVGPPVALEVTDLPGDGGGYGERRQRGRDRPGVRVVGTEERHEEYGASVVGSAGDPVPEDGARHVSG
ncbi:uncharacterized protein METZ01_LOCUS225671, partial [marine metagenome]